MVEVAIFMEGGVLPNDNISVQTLDNSQKLRESIYTIISKLIDNNSFSITIQQSAGFLNAVKFFKAKLDKNTILLLDLDNPKDFREAKLKELDLGNYKDKIFFMVQEMEAWIISQPEQIDELYKSNYFRELASRSISDDNLIKGKHPEEIAKPSWVLKVLLRRYFSYQIRNKKRKKEYGKLKDAPDLLNKLDSQKLQAVFIDLKMLIDTIKKME